MPSIETSAGCDVARGYFNLSTHIPSVKSRIHPPFGTVSAPLFAQRCAARARRRRTYLFCQLCSPFEKQELPTRFVEYELAWLLQLVLPENVRFLILIGLEEALVETAFEDGLIGLPLSGEPTALIEDKSSLKIIASARAEIRRHPHFKGRDRWIRVQCPGRRLLLSGRVPSFYLKQLAQEAVRGVNGVDRIINEIVVTSPTGETAPQNR